MAVEAREVHRGEAGGPCRCSEQRLVALIQLDQQPDLSLGKKSVAGHFSGIKKRVTLAPAIPQSWRWKGLEAIDWVEFWQPWRSVLGDYSAVLEALQACPALRTFDLTGCALVGEAVLTRAEAHCRRELIEEASAKKARANGDSHRSSA